jgi:uncharacterized protein
MKTILTAALRLYKWLISPLIPPACRYVPSCSEYAMEAVEVHGVLRGSVLAAWRLLRCHPFAKGGYDPVLSTEYRVLSTSSPHIHLHEK